MATDYRVVIGPHTRELPKDWTLTQQPGTVPAAIQRSRDNVLAILYDPASVPAFVPASATAQGPCICSRLTHRLLYKGRTTASSDNYRPLSGVLTQTREWTLGILPQRMQTSQLNIRRKIPGVMFRAEYFQLNAPS